ncbi:hypothetical protein JHW43_002423 [Diplocarpon mali]|nr:hypothetical protein JHW43_002423 [Diplocarpon mali]
MNLKNSSHVGVPMNPPQSSTRSWKSKAWKPMVYDQKPTRPRLAGSVHWPEPCGNLGRTGGALMLAVCPAVVEEAIGAIASRVSWTFAPTAEGEMRTSDASEKQAPHSLHPWNVLWRYTVPWRGVQLIVNEEHPENQGLHPRPHRARTKASPRGASWLVQISLQAVRLRLRLRTRSGLGRSGRRSSGWDALSSCFADGGGEHVLDSAGSEHPIRPRPRAATERGDVPGNATDDTRATPSEEPCRRVAGAGRRRRPRLWPAASPDDRRADAARARHCVPRVPSGPKVPQGQPPASCHAAEPGSMDPRAKAALKTLPEFGTRWCGFRSCGFLLGAWTLLLTWTGQPHPLRRQGLERGVSRDCVSHPGHAPTGAASSSSATDEPSPHRGGCVTRWRGVSLPASLRATTLLGESEPLGMRVFFRDREERIGTEPLSGTGGRASPSPSRKPKLPGRSPSRPGPGATLRLPRRQPLPSRPAGVPPDPDPDAGEGRQPTAAADEAGCGRAPASAGSGVGFFAVRAGASSRRGSVSRVGRLGGDAADRCGVVVSEAGSAGRGSRRVVGSLSHGGIAW